MQLTLYYSPGACSRVTLNALEALELDYQAVRISLQDGHHKRPEFLAINPNGKVPALKIDDRVLCQNAMIIWTLHRLFGRSRLLPEDNGSPIEQHEFLADLCWCADTFHPIVRQNKMPVRFTTGDQAGVREDGVAKLTEVCERLSHRVADGWWYGQEWSIIDAYLCWGLDTATSGGFPIENFPVMKSLADRARQMPSMQRAIARETQVPVDQ